MAETQHKFSASDLAQFTGTMQYYRIPMFKTVLTDGVHFLLENDCAWLVTDALAVLQHVPAVAVQPFIAVKATPNPDGSATVIYDDGDYNVVHKQSYLIADLPCEVKMFCCDGVLLLASEY